MAINWDVDKLVADVRASVMEGVVFGAELVGSAAIYSIMNGSKTGVIYTRKSVFHQASAPGEAPASDTGRLVQSMRTEHDAANLLSGVIFSTAYAAALEYGRLDGSIAARPYARPALASKRKEIGQDIENRVFNSIERGKTV